MWKVLLSPLYVIYNIPRQVLLIFTHFILYYDRHIRLVPAVSNDTWYTICRVISGTGVCGDLYLLWSMGPWKPDCNTWHYCYIIMGAKASQITSLTIVYSTVYSDAEQRKHQSSASLAFVRRIHRWPVNSPHKWPVMRKMFPFDDVIVVWSAFIMIHLKARYSWTCHHRGRYEDYITSVVSISKITKTNCFNLFEDRVYVPLSKITDARCSKVIQVSRNDWKSSCPGDRPSRSR